MLVANMGNGPCWTYTSSPRQQVCSGSNRVCYLVYRDQATHKDNFSNITFFLAKHHLQIWSSKDFNYGQGQTLQKSYFKRRQYRETLVFVSVYHPESNGAIERANREVFVAITKTLHNLHKGKWVEELPKSFHKTTASRTTKYAPFKLMYEEEAMTQA